MGRRKTLDKKNLKLYSVALLAVFIIATFSGCTDKPEELQEKVNIYVYEDTGGKGDPQEVMNEFFDIALQAGEPVITPLAQYAVELDPDTGGIISIYDSDGNPVDREKALAMQGNIARDDAGNIITDEALLDLHINPIGKNKYEILNLKQELEDEDGGTWRVIGTENPSFDKNLVDNEIKVGDGKDEMYGGLVRGSDDNIYGVIIVDEDVFDMYGGDFGIKAKGVNPDGIVKEECIDLGGGLYAYVYPLPENGAFIHSPYLLSQEAHIADEENNGNFAQFLFVKEES